ncbi:MAG: hypothetical protein A2X36_00825 [Elusimicrobia bacterium GWA2_69_24]|nr:MAG: hypothetical protein A2X36_00825 [Elusimicrobia bacterium GWA2_69_24]
MAYGTSQDPRSARWSPSWTERPGWLPFLTGCSLVAVYVSLPSYLFNFDGVACAIAVELGDLKHLVHGNHLVYGLTGLAFHRLLAAAGLGWSAIAALQFMGCALGAWGAGSMCALLLRAGFGKSSAVLAALGLGVSYIWWLRSVDAQVYVLAALFLVWCLDEALRPSPRPYRLALWHGLAMLSHASHALLTPLVLYSLWRSRPAAACKRDAGVYLCAAALLVAASYAAAAVLWVRPSGLDELRVWLLGSAALGPGRTPMWIGFSSPAQAVGDWLKASVGIVSPALWLALPVWLAAASTLDPRRLGEFRTAAVSGWIWLASYPALFLFWEPYKLDYHMTDLIPLWLLAAVGTARRLRGRRAQLGAAAFVLALAAVNGVRGIRPVSDPAMNRSFQKALWLEKVTPENAWIASEGLDKVYIPYFAHRRPLILGPYQGRGAELRERVAGLRAPGDPVFFTSDILRDEHRLALAGSVFEPRGSESGIDLLLVR